MIDKAEIDRVAADLQVRPTDVERDYVFGLLLSGIYGGSPLGKRLVLKGGNALRKGYFANTRYSGDLDFSTEGAIPAHELKSMLIEVCDRVGPTSGVAFLNEQASVEEKNRLQKDLQVLEARLAFRDFYGKPGSIVLKARMDVTQYDRLMLPAAERQLIHPYSDADGYRTTIRCVALEEILASKLKCLLQRRHVADLFDYVHWLAFGQQGVDTKRVLQVFLQKTIYSSSPGAALGLLLKIPFQFLRDAWGKYIVCPIKAAIEFDDAIERFFTHLRSLFDGYSEQLGWHSSDAFFPAELRNVILEAGSRMTLVRMTYKGEVREVEPYSLKFKDTKEGGSREYFYAWNASGGSGGGIRTFVASEMQDAEVTDTKFVPRYPVEVSRAGDVAMAGSFSTGRRVPAFGITRQPRRKATGIRYLYRCSSCNRLSVRTTTAGAIRPHKRRGGGTCYGFPRFVGSRY